VVVYKAAGAYAVPASRAAGETESLERTVGFAARLRYTSALRGFAARLSTQEVKQIEDDPEVALVAPDTKLQALGTVPRLTGETLPSGVGRIGAAPAGTAHEASSTSVAVLDTGVQLNHADLNVEDGINCNGLGHPQDFNGHGTMIAGVIAAKNNGGGIVGVAPGTKVYAVKVLNGNGNGFDSQVICGIDWVTAHAAALNIRVANLSLGGPGPGGPCEADPLHLAICTSTAAGVLYTVAAGNDARDFAAIPLEVPAAYPEVMTVTAMSDSDGAAGGTGAPPACVPGEHDDFIATFSNFATTEADTAHTIAAPGVCILSTSRLSGYGVETGSSFAAPHVAGVAALCLGENGAAGPCAGLTPAQIVQKLRRDAAEHATATNGFVGDPLHSFGRFYGHLASAEQSTLPLPPPPPRALAVAAPPPPSSKGQKQSCRVPKLRRLKAASARRKLRRAGCRYRIRGHGRVRSTFPAAGRRTERVVVVRLSRRVHPRLNAPA
jgi:subtilisin